MTDIEQNLCIEIGREIGARPVPISVRSLRVVLWHCDNTVLFVTILEGRLMLRLNVQKSEIDGESWLGNPNIPTIEECCFDLSDPHLIDNIRNLFLRLAIK